MTNACLKTLMPFATALLFLSHLLISTSYASTSPPEWSGSFKSLNLHGEEAPADLFSEYQLSSNRARLNMDWQAASSLKLETALDYQYLWSNQPDDFIRTANNNNRHLDMDKSWQHGEHGTSYLQVDRLSLQWHIGALDATIGRQAIGFGRILIYSPLDVIAPFAPDAIDTEIRGGIDALHTVFNYGLDGQLGAIVIWGEDSRYDSFLATWSDNHAGVDMLMIGGRLRGHNMFGAGLAGSIGTLGLKGEFSLHEGRDVGKIGGDLHDSYTLAAVESWYRFDNGLSVIAQYLYNGPGVDDPEKYPRVISSAPLQEGLTYLLGRHYLILAPAYELHPLATAQGLILYNLKDDSALIRPTLDLNLADNLSLQLFWTWNVGRKPEVAATLSLPEIRSEFGLRGDSGGLFLNWYF